MHADLEGSPPPTAQRVLVRRVILTSASCVFAAIFDATLAFCDPATGTVVVPFEWPVFEVALRHMEGARCDVTSLLDMRRAVRVLGVASFYCLSDLQRQAEAFVRGNVTHSNVVSVLSDVVLHGAYSACLQSWLLDWICLHSVDVLSDVCWLELRVDVVVLLLREVIDGGSEMRVFELCVAWAERRVLSAHAEVHVVLEPLLTFIDWSLLSAAEIERVSSLGVLRDGVLSERLQRGAELLEAYGCDGVRHCRARRWRWIQLPWSFSGAVPLRCDVVCGPDTTDHHTRPITALTALPRGVFRSAGDGHVVASGSWGRTIKFWVLEDQRCLGTIRTGLCMFCLVYVGRDCIASGHYDTVTVWHAPSGALRHPLRGHSSLVCSLTMVTDSVLASGSADCSIRLWDVDTGECLRTLENAHGGWVNCLLMYQSLLVSSGSWDTLIKVWRMPSGDAVATLRGHTESIETMTHVDATHIASGSDDHTLRIWNMVTLTCEHTIDNACGGKAVDCAVLLGPWLICGGYGDSADAIQFLRVWNASSGLRVHTLEQPKRHKQNHVMSMLSVGDSVVVGEAGTRDCPPSIMMWH